MVKQSTRMFLAVTTALWVCGAAAENHAHTHPHFPKDIDAFHSLLAPIWHAPQGTERSRNACLQVAGMEKGAREIRSADAAGLITSILALKSGCETSAADVDGALSDVHDAFHGLIDARPRAAKR